jgi:hypothetical protein
MPGWASNTSQRSTQGAKRGKAREEEEEDDDVVEVVRAPKRSKKAEAAADFDMDAMEG